MKNQMNVVATLIKVMKTALTNISQSDMAAINNIEITSKPWTIVAMKQSDKQYICFLGINERNVAELLAYRTENGRISFGVPDVLFDNITADMLYAVSLNRQSGLEDIETIIRTAVTPCYEIR